MNSVENSNPRKTNKLLIIAIVVLAMLVTLLIGLLIGKNTNSSADKVSTSQSTSQTETTTNADTKQSKQEIPAEAKKLIDSLQRRSENDPRARGAVDAPVVIVAFADLRCHYCAQFALTVEPALQARIDAGEVRLEFNHLPVLGTDSETAAYAAQAAAEQGKFWEYQHALYTWVEAGTGVYTEEALTQLASEVGVVDLEKFRADFNSATIRKIVTDEQSVGLSKLGIQGTPAFIVGYSYVPGMIDFANLDKLIAAELAR